jgi:ATPase complex subunit ATP10
MHKGKSFLAPPRIFKAERALFFPNFRGQTLSKDKVPKDTTPILEDNISIVCVFSSAWAENQVATFVSQKANPELHAELKNSGSMAQIIRLNVEENSLKATLIKFFMGSLRRRLGVENWNRYFLVQRGVTEEIRDAVGLLNSKVGYIYLLDGECKIRWAGSGVANNDEKEGLVKATKRLIEELKTKRKARLALPQQQAAEEKPAQG